MPRPRRKPPPAEQPIEELKFKTVHPLNKEQAKLIQIIHSNSYIFLPGVAGGGKTHISCGLGAEYLQRKLIDRLVISRPIVGSENGFGSLPGSYSEKLQPYVDPILFELSYFINVKKYIDLEKVVILPVNFMRGHTFRNSFIIIDECENLTYNQLKLILTRVGESSKIVLNGDTTQSDLDYRHYRDFEKVIDKMGKIATPENGIAIFHMTESVRNPMIKKILATLERDE